MKSLEEPVIWVFVSSSSRCSLNGTLDRLFLDLGAPFIPSIAMSFLSFMEKGSSA